MTATTIVVPRDEPLVSALTGTNRPDISQPVLIYANPDTHSLFVESYLENTQNITTSIYATNLVIKTTPGRLKGLTGYNSKGSSQFIQLHDAVSLPAESSIPKIIFTV